MSLKEVADAVVEANRNGKTYELLDTHYADDVVSVESTPMSEEAGREIHGRDGIRGKHDWWFANTEVHSSSVDGPYPHGDDKFAVIYEMDVTAKPDGKRMQMKEIAVYTVKDGKVVREEFYYDM
ncbi:MAG: nuclear transport factor 2 family protein [Pseudomonadota bacterium]